jgi:hypothetical protein
LCQKFFFKNLQKWQSSPDPCLNQCSGSVTIWYGSGSADLYPGLTDPDSDPDLDPALFVSNLQDANTFFFLSFLTYYFLTLSYVSKITSCLYPQMVSLPLKKKTPRHVLSEGNAAHPVGSDSPL